MPVKPVPKPEEGSRPPRQDRDYFQKAKESIKTKVDDAVPGPSNDSPVVEKEENNNEPEAFVPKPTPQPPKKRNVEFTREDLERIESETHLLDEKNTILFSLNSVVRSDDEEIPDSFFDLTVSDIRVLMNQMKENVQSMDNAPLMTSKLRELEDAKKTLIQLQYHETLIRIQFPNRLVLQAVFKPIDTVADVKQFIRTFLKEDVAEFALCKFISFDELFLCFVYLHSKL